MAEKELKTAEELKAILDKELMYDGPLDGPQFIKVVPADPRTGANWHVAHSGPGQLSGAIDRVQVRMKKLYDMR